MIVGGGGGIGEELYSSMGGNIFTDSKIVIPNI
jgi:hypothetical protein